MRLGETLKGNIVALEDEVKTRIASTLDLGTRPVCILSMVSRLRLVWA